MNAVPPPDYSPEALLYFNKWPIINTSKLAYLRWIPKAPFLSRTGGRAITAYAQGPCPDAWQRELAGKRVLVVGSGPSLDRVDSAFFDGFDAFLYINFAVRRRRGAPGEYFFSTDAGPTREYINKHGVADYLALGRDHCILAPIFLDQWHALTPRGRALFTWLAFDEAHWFTQGVGTASVKLPLLWRYGPRQPDWESFSLPARGRTQPVMGHTSALSAILFAAIHGAREIGLIGCDFSAGRAASVQSNQVAASQSTFSGATAEFHRIAAMLARHDIAITNHSWVV